jgi:hypothetical protein
MYRLLSCPLVGHRHLPTAGAWLPFCPRRFFSASLTDSLVSPLGWGVAAVPPQPVF